MVLIWSSSSNTNPPKIKINHKTTKRKKLKKKNQWYGSGNSSPNTTPQIQDNHQTTTKKIILKKKSKVMTLETY
nr:hypothetical protein [Mycoplasmopsis bovis]